MNRPQIISFDGPITPSRRIAKPTLAQLDLTETGLSIVAQCPDGSFLVVDGGRGTDENKAILDSLNVLPDSCAASADCLEAQRAFYEKDGVFAPTMIDGLIATLRKFNDRTLRADIGNDQAKILELVEKYFHC